MSFASAFANMATGLSAAFGVPFIAGAVHSPGVPVFDDGGSIVTPGDATRRDCMAQVDVATEAMRAAEGYADGDVRILVLSEGLGGTITTDDRIEIDSGPHAGMWLVQAVTQDPAGIGFELRARRG
jgi:hypothetical protein